MTIAYEAEVFAAAPATVAPYAELKGNATRRAKVREMGMFSNTATAAQKTLLARPAVVGTQTGTVAGGPQDPADAASTALLASTWSVAPTQPVAPSLLRAWEFNNVVGSGIILTWPSDGELVVPAVAPVSVVIWNNGASTGPAASIYFVWSE